jgi:signal transduction histidine kinase
VQADSDQRLIEAALRLAAGGHDIVNLLTSVEGHLQLFTMSETEVPEEISTALKAASAARQLITSLLGASGQFLPQTTPVSALVRGVVGFSRPLWEANSITVEIIGDLSAVPPLAMPPDAAQRVLLNVLLNAIAALNPLGRVTISVTQHSPMIIFQIADTGRGIAPAVESILFQPFATNRSDGTGLGLAGSRQLIEQHGGSIQITSTLGSGTVVTIAIPHAS